MDRFSALAARLYCCTALTGLSILVSIHLTYFLLFSSRCLSRGGVRAAHGHVHVGRERTKARRALRHAPLEARGAFKPDRVTFLISSDTWVIVAEVVVVNVCFLVVPLPG